MRRVTALSVLQANGFFLGLAVWPGGSVEDWGEVYSASLGRFGLSPCNTSGVVPGTNVTPKAYLASRSVAFATFEVKVDALVALTLNQTDLDAAVNLSAPYASVVAFRGPFRSEAAYIYSSTADITQAEGRVLSLSLILRFDRGSLTHLQWSDFSCSGCGGPRSSQCLITSQPQPQQSCTVPAGGCVNGTDCSLTIFGGFSGSDRAGLAFTTGLQLSKISQFALSTYFYNALAQLARLKQSISTGEVGASNVGSGTGEAAK